MIHRSLGKLGTPPPLSDLYRSTYLDQPEYSPDPEDPDNPEQGRGDREVCHQVLQDHQYVKHIEKISRIEYCL